MIPEGRYLARAKSAQFGTSPVKGTDFVLVTFELIGDTLPERSIGWYGYFSGGASKYTIESLKNCGCTFPEGDITDLTGLGSRDAELNIRHEEWEGKTRAKVAFVNSPGGVSPESKMGPAQLAGLKAKMRANLLASGPVPGPDPAFKLDPKKDDIPF